MPGNSGSGPRNWGSWGPAAALPAPPFVVINPPQEPVAQAVLLVTAVLWAFTAWRRGRVPARA
ncbi:hypothetical protein ACFY12_29745 [Streptomyces sp. NPDC001339]|uniref:hypothetical protein n=1 Tax=Streptomyces sp. NPDC001339 TaxID=3364563 RepID=UPI0036B8ADAB